MILDIMTFYYDIFWVNLDLGENTSLVLIFPRGGKPLSGLDHFLVQMGFDITECSLVQTSKQTPAYRIVNVKEKLVFSP